MSQIDTSKMSSASRKAVNWTTRAWTLTESHNIADVCILADLFGGKRHTRAITQLRAQLRRYLDENLRCRKPKGGPMEFQFVGLIPEGERGWKKLSNLALSTFVGMCHTTEIAARKKEREKAPVDHRISTCNLTEELG